MLILFDVFTYEGAETPLHLCFLSGNEPKGAFWADLRPMGFE
jgi:hypothetical protein